MTGEGSAVLVQGLVLAFLDILDGISVVLSLL